MLHIAYPMYILLYPPCINTQHTPYCIHTLYTPHCIPPPTQSPYHTTISHLHRLDKELAQLKKDIEAINQARNLQQLDMKKDLVALENEWKATIAKNVEIERACAALEAQILALRKEKGYVMGVCVNWGMGGERRGMGEGGVCV